jgi:hypothetical protein
MAGSAAYQVEQRPDEAARLRTLFLAANPQSMTRLGLDQEIRKITQKIRMSDGRDTLEVVSVWAVQPADLLQYLNEYKPQIVHFSGHGTTAGEIVLVDQAGSARPVGERALKALFGTMKDNIQLVVLNACYSRTQAAAIGEVVDYVIGMKSAIGDEAAIVFAASLYSALGFNRTVREAFEQARTALLLAGIPEEDTPELLVRSGVSADRRLAASPSATSLPRFRLIDRGKLRSGLTLGWQMARYEFADQSPFPEAAAAAPEILREIADIIRRDAIVEVPAEPRAHELLSTVLRGYAASSPEHHAAILIGIAALRASLVGASRDDAQNQEMEAIARSAIMEIDPTVLPTVDKPAYFDALRKARPRNVVALLEFVDAHAQGR